MSKIIKFIKNCPECGKEMISTTWDVTGEEGINVYIDFIDGTNFQCECGYSCCIYLETFSE